MKFGIIREGKNPPDKRAVFSPEKLAEFREKYPDATFKVQRSPIRTFDDEAYASLGFEVAEDVSDCDVLLGVKEVPISDLIPNKTYFFFSHTIKEQPHNRKLLQACLKNNIRLIDHETLVDHEGKRLIGFGRYAGIVGTYNTLRAFGIKYDLFQLKKVEELNSQNEMIQRLSRPVLPPIKIVLTGKGKVGMGAKEILDAKKIKEVSVDEFLNKEFDEPVYVNIDVQDYYKRKDGKPSSKADFIENSSEYESDFAKYSEVADIFIAGHYYREGSPHILTRDMLNSPRNELKIVGDISCDVGGPIACTLRASTIANPIYGYYPREHKEVSIEHPAAVVVMAVDNLPCELPKDASEGFGKVFLEKIIPAFFNGDKDRILSRGTICENGLLKERFGYLKDYASE